MKSLSQKAFRVIGKPLVVEATIAFAPGHLNVPLEPREFDKPIKVEYPKGSLVELYEKQAILKGRTETFFVDERGLVHTHDEVKFRLSTDHFREVA